MKKTKLYLSVFLIIATWLHLFLLSPAFAAVQTVEVDGYYTMGDGLEENPNTAKARAKLDAQVRAAEMAGVYVEKNVAVKNHQLIGSEIKSLTAAVLQIKEVKYTPEVVGDVIKYSCHLVAVVDDSRVQEALSNREQLEEVLMRERAKDEKIAELTRQMEEYKQKYQSAQTEAQRQEIRREAKKNEAELEAMELVNQCGTFVENHNYAKLIEYANKALALDPDSYLAQYYLGYANAEQGLLTKDIAQFRKGQNLILQVIQSDALSASVRSMMCFTAGGLQLKNGDIVGADYLYQMATSIHPRNSYAYTNRGAIRAMRKDYDTALQCLQKAISIDPQNYRAYDLLGGVYTDRGQYAEALAAFNKAIAINPSYSSAYNNRGVTYEMLGRRKEAKRDFAKAYELYPNDEKVRRNKQRSENW